MEPNPSIRVSINPFILSFKALMALCALCALMALLALSALRKSLYRLINNSAISTKPVTIVPTFIL